MANNQYNFLDYAGLSLFWNNVKSIIEENELATASALTNLDTRVDNLEASKSDKGHTHTSILDVNGSSATTFAYSKAGLNYSDYEWLAGWNGYELRAVSKSQFAQASHTHSYIVTHGDNRNIASKPSDYNNRITFAGLKTNDIVGNPSSTTYNYVVGLRGWSDTSGGKAHELAFNDNGVFHRIGATDTWEAWTMMLTTSNYNSYAPSLTGSGASGTWGISITGNANYATTAGSAPASDVKAWAKADTKPSYTGSEVKLTGYSKASSYSEISASDTVNQAIAKLERALSGLEALLASI